MCIYIYIYIYIHIYIYVCVCYFCNVFFSPLPPPGLSAATFIKLIITPNPLHFHFPGKLLEV